MSLTCAGSVSSSAITGFMSSMYTSHSSYCQKLYTRCVAEANSYASIFCTYIKGSSVSIFANRARTAHYGRQRTRADLWHVNSYVSMLCTLWQAADTRRPVACEPIHVHALHIDAV